MISLNRPSDERRIIRNAIGILSSDIDLVEIRVQHRRFKEAMKVLLGVISSTMTMYKKEIDMMCRQGQRELTEKIDDLYNQAVKYSYDFSTDESEAKTFVDDVNQQILKQYDRTETLIRQIKEEYGVELPVNDIDSEMVNFEVTSETGKEMNNTLFSSYLGSIDMINSLTEFIRADGNFYTSKLKYLKSYESKYLFRFAQYMRVVSGVLTELQNQYENVDMIVKSYQLCIYILDYITMNNKARTLAFIEDNTFDSINAKVAKYFTVN